jgi:hypothetical protein
MLAEPADNKEVISGQGGFFNYFWKEIRRVIEWFREIKTADQWGTGLVNRKAADDGITKYYYDLISTTIYYIITTINISNSI